MSEAPYVFKPHERPTLPGSPANPDHPGRRRAIYFAIGILVGITGGLGNALVTVNLNFAQGTLGLNSNESAWLTAAYFMTNVTANLLLVKYRQQFGLQSFVRYVLGAYALTTLFHLFVHGFWSSVAVRAASGVAASGLTTMTILYLMQSMPAPKRLAGVMIGISIPQLATPLARMLSPGLLEWGDWHMLYWFELGLALATLAAIMALPLPPSEREKVFEKTDFLTFALLAPGLWLLIAVLSEGRIEWWTERAWMGYALIGSVLLIAAALLVEHHRDNPLINTRWLGTREMARLMLVAASIRVLLSEQAFGSVGLLTVAGMINDQMVMLNFVIVLASIAGLATAVLTFNPVNVARPITIAIILIAIGAFMDADSTNLTRPSSFYISQALIGFASLLFMAQAMVIGIARTLLAGGKNFISFVVLFSMSQSIGGLIGTAFLGTFQVLREKFHSHALVQNIVMTDPLVAARIRAGSGAVTGVVGDPALRSAEGAAILAQQATREANILAYNDVFLLIGVLAIMAVIWSISIRYSIRKRGEISPVVLLQRKMQEQAAAMAAKSAGAN
ncbi:MFS transporter [Sphingobium phenoxybenzoativorans]|uniref:MFS transporter n=1 Tax=Sphingobium phenoxybenzoativorans TaxID=1592790 RepID=A0A975K7I4_9SPHN|nr:MFS transporter [Sphingobium phenoxybenzoativorans]QUT06240.1 MFS transporter [Sphingobium phenoxybenzoativorans]